MTGKILLTTGLFALGAALASCGSSDTAPRSTTEEPSMNATTSAYRDIPFETMDGDTTSLAELNGHVVLIVNVASKCGYTPQYEGLEALYKQYQDQGLVVVGFPANNFGGQEPGTNEEIMQFCQSTFGVTFPMMAKVSVKGADKHPLFAYLTEQSPIVGEIKWNFSKFLLDKNGQLIARYDSGVKPDAEELKTKIEQLLAA